jgi:fermentation-respiration switch protein FrsA (DUF1100 family)
VSEVRRHRLLRRAARWLVLLGLTYLGIVAVFWFLERRLVFPATSAAEEWLDPEDKRSQDVTFTSADGATIHGRWIPPEAPERGAVLVFNGNGGNLTHRGRLAAQFRQTLGAGVLLFDYPGYGKNPGTPTEEGCYAASEAAYTWLTDEQKVPPNRIILCGQSLGGGPAVELATKHDHRALVLIYTFASVPAVAKDRFPFLPTHTLMRTRFDNLGKIARCPRPVFIVHGTDDRVIGIHHSEQLFAAANEPKHFLRIPDFGHSALIGEPFTSELASFLQKHAP